MGREVKLVTMCLIFGALIAGGCIQPNSVSSSSDRSDEGYERHSASFTWDVGKPPKKDPSAGYDPNLHPPADAGAMQPN